MNRESTRFKATKDPVLGDACELWRSIARVALSDPDRAAVEEFHAGGGRTRWTYARLFSLAAGFSVVLAERVRPGEVVLLDGGGGARHVAWMLAAIRAGVWVLPVPMQTTREELGELQRRTRAEWIIGTERHQDQLRVIDFQMQVEPHSQAPESDSTTPGSLGGIVLVTSGTTGERKLVMRGSEALDADAAGVISATGMCAEDRVLLAISLSHSYGIDMLAGTLHAGATLEVVPTFDLAALVSRLADGATVFPGVPFLFEGLTPRWEGAGDLRLVFSAGARLPGATRAAFESAAGLLIGDLYGSTELGTVIFRDPCEGEPESGLIGTALPGVSVRILSTSDRACVLGCGEEGELAILASSMLRGYLDGPTELVDGHYVTGDLARVDEHGRVFLTGRTGFIIESGGLKLNPMEIEGLLEAHPGVAECLVVAMPISDTITRIKALVVPMRAERPPSDSELRGFLREKVGPAKIPRRFEMVASLPKNASGKVQRPHSWGASCEESR